MNCAEVMGRLSEYVDGELGMWDSLRLRVHVRRCEECARQLRVAQAVDAKLAMALEESVEFPDLSAAIMSALPERPVAVRSGRSVGFRRVLAYGAVGVSVVAGLVWYCLPEVEMPGSQAVKIAAPLPKPDSVEPKGPQTVKQPQADKATPPEASREERTAAVGKARRASPGSKPVSVQNDLPVSVFSVTMSGRPSEAGSSTGRPGSITSAEVMGRQVEFDMSNGGAVEKPMAECAENPDVERHPLQPVEKTDPLLDRIRGAAF